MILLSVSFCTSLSRFGTPREVTPQVNSLATLKKGIQAIDKMLMNVFSLQGDKRSLRQNAKGGRTVRKLNPLKNRCLNCLPWSLSLRVPLLLYKIEGTLNCSEAKRDQRHRPSQGLTAYR